MLTPLSQLFPSRRTSAGTRRVGPAALLLTLLAVLAFSGCSGDDSDDSDGGAGGDGSSASADGTDAPSGDASADSEEGADGGDGGAAASDPPSLPSAPEIARAVGATDDLVYDLATCPTKAGTVSLKGKVKNPTRKPAGYSITFSWLDDEAQVVGRGVAVLKKVKPGATARWRMDATLGKGASQCVPNVLRGTIAAKS